ncbi:MAG: hypothetical protein NZM35_11325 [Chitinophagales bacterium]|nr:hypothetical protein [Chitinophagales bacterium]MDW8419912.1 hypothetical protein [Chitinophagales bacterium]
MPVIKKVLFILLGVIVTGVAITLLVCNYTYSEGTRAGVLTKLSKRGYILKTYEGELNMGGMGNIPNTAPANQIWYFSVKDAAMADTLRQYEGQRVVLSYEEKIKAMPWQGETNYFVVGVRKVE